uniref:Gustatory receptor n=1 Tax=Anopheles epiroticus TaxID=199890 RepID=A0A182P332_9DIPT
MSTYIRQNRFTLRFLASIYFLPASYSQTAQRFVEQRTNLVSFVAGILLSIGFLYHDFIFQNVFFVDLAPFSFGIILLEMFLFEFVPFCVIFNGCFYRKRLTRLLNVLFADDSVLDLTNVSMSGAYRLYIHVLTMVVVLFELYCLVVLDTIEQSLMLTSYVLRFVGMVHLLYLFHLCVSVIGWRMEQLKVLLNRTQNDEDDGLEYIVELFLARFERYATQIDEINHCFSIPILTILVLGIVELVYVAFECFYFFSTGKPDIEMFSGYLDWILSQFWQSMYSNILVLTVSSCERTWKKVEETALCTRHFDDYRLQNTRAAKQIQKFLLKNLHQKKKFSACGFFDIDNTVIYMVFSSIVTYLVILIQFKQLETDLTQSPGSFNVTNNGTTVDP